MIGEDSKGRKYRMLSRRYLPHGGLPIFIIADKSLVLWKSFVFCAQRNIYFFLSKNDNK